MSSLKFGTYSILPKDSIITIQYKLKYSNGDTDTDTRKLYVVRDKIGEDGFHQIMVDDTQKMTGNRYSLLTYGVDNNTIYIRGITRTSLGYASADVQEISGVKVIKVQLPNKDIIWPRSHTGFQTRKIW